MYNNDRLFSSQCPLKWTTLQAVVSPGKNPLPAEVQIKRHLTKGDEFYNTFALFEYTYDEVIKKYFPQLPMPHDACISKVIKIIKACQATCLMEMNMEIIQLQNSNPTLVGTKRDIAEKFNHTCACISCGYIARLLLNAISTYQVGKNWNSHGATLGATLCQMASMFSCLGQCFKRLFD